MYLLLRSAPSSSIFISSIICSFFISYLFVTWIFCCCCVPINVSELQYQHGTVARWLSDVKFVFFYNSYLQVSLRQQGVVMHHELYGTNSAPYKKRSISNFFSLLSGMGNSHFIYLYHVANRALWCAMYCTVQTVCRTKRGRWFWIIFVKLYIELLVKKTIVVKKFLLSWC